MMSELETLHECTEDIAQEVSSFVPLWTSHLCARGYLIRSARSLINVIDFARKPCKIVHGEAEHVYFSGMVFPNVRLNIQGS